MTKRQRQKSQSVTGPKDSKKKLKTEDIHTQRNDPDHRGIHEDAIRVGRAPTSASTCVACDKRIEKDSPRWGLKYGGNPLTIPVLPLYGSNPMVLWCHPACGLSYVRYSDLPSEAAAARTCHACQDSPDHGEDDSKSTIRLLCGGPPKQRKIRQHAFHISCWIRAIQISDSSLAEKLMVKPEDIGKVKTKKKNNGLSWDDLSPKEHQQVQEEFDFGK
jgi:hypothetical protein